MIASHHQHHMRRHTLQAASRLGRMMTAARGSPNRSLTISAPFNKAKRKPQPPPKAKALPPKETLNTPPPPPPPTPKPQPPPPSEQTPKQPIRETSFKDSSKPQTLSHLLDKEKRKLPLIGLGLAAAVMGAYLSMLAISMTNGPDVSGITHDCVPSGRPTDLRHGKISAIMFDKDLDRPESLMGIKGLRQLMGGLARGHVLEVAVGTGRNVEWIDWDEIKAVAPPVTTFGKDGVEQTGEVKSAQQLARERALRRVEKGKKGMLLPGEEAPEVLSYTGVDVSVDVLEVAWGKLKKAVPELIPRRRKRSVEEEQAESQQPNPSKMPAPRAAASQLPQQPDDTERTLAANIGQGRIRLYRSDAQLHLPPPPALVTHDGTRPLPAPPYYDTVLQNFGLCSVADPQKMIASMAAVVRPDTGRIYLLEHGRGSYSWLNSLLDMFAPRHFVRYGCWWNRDIEELVRKAEKEVPGLEVVRLERPLWTQAGTMFWIELKVNSGKERRSLG